MYFHQKRLQKVLYSPQIYLLRLWLNVDNHFSLNKLQFHLRQNTQPITR